VNAVFNHSLRYGAAQPMSVKESLEYLDNQISERICRFKKSRNFYQRGSLIQTISAASLAAVTTLLVGLNQIYHQNWLAALSLVSAGLTTVVAAWGSWFGFRRLWVSNQQTLNGLYKLSSKIEYDKKVAGALQQNQVDSYYRSYQEILDAANSTWAETRSSQQ
jgi:hypothetical protein